jgi:nucleolar protein 12
MAKSKDKQPAKAESRQKSDKPFTSVDKKAFDPALASLFASSVCEQL